MKTIRLQRPTVDVRPAIPALIMTVVIGLLVSVNLAADWPRPAAPPTAAPTAALPIIVIATRAPEPQQQLVIERVIQVIVTATPQAAPAEQPAPAEAPVMQVESVQPTPIATAWVADPAIVHNPDGSTVSAFDPPTNAPQLCTGFHDWRDYDANYAGSPVCHQR